MHINQLPEYDAFVSLYDTAIQELEASRRLKDSGVSVNVDEGLSGLVHGTSVMTMELLPKRASSTIHDTLTWPVSSTVRKQIGVACARATWNMHAHGVFHNDLHHQNAFIVRDSCFLSTKHKECKNPRFEARIIDFGLSSTDELDNHAFALDDRTRQTATRNAVLNGRVQDLWRLGTSLFVSDQNAGFNSGGSCEGFVMEYVRLCPKNTVDSKRPGELQVLTVEDATAIFADLQKANTHRVAELNKKYAAEANAKQLKQTKYADSRQDITAAFVQIIRVSVIGEFLNARLVWNVNPPMNELDPLWETFDELPAIIQKLKGTPFEALSTQVTFEAPTISPTMSVMALMIRELATPLPIDVEQTISSGKAFEFKLPGGHGVAYQFLLQQNLKDPNELSPFHTTVAAQSEKELARAVAMSKKGAEHDPLDARGVYAQIEYVGRSGLVRDEPANPFLPNDAIW